MTAARAQGGRCRPARPRTTRPCSSACARGARRAAPGRCPRTWSSPTPPSSRSPRRLPSDLAGSPGSRGSARASSTSTARCCSRSSPTSRSRRPERLRQQHRVVPAGPHATSFDHDQVGRQNRREPCCAAGAAFVRFTRDLSAAARRPSPESPGRRRPDRSPSAPGRPRRLPRGAPSAATTRHCRWSVAAWRARTSGGASSARWWRRPHEGRVRRSHAADSGHRRSPARRHRFGISTKVQDPLEGSRLRRRHRLTSSPNPEPDLRPFCRRSTRTEQHRTAHDAPGPQRLQHAATRPADRSTPDAEPAPRPARPAIGAARKEMTTMSTSSQRAGPPAPRR